MSKSPTFDGPVDEMLARVWSLRESSLLRFVLCFRLCYNIIGSIVHIFAFVNFRRKFTIHPNLAILAATFVVTDVSYSIALAATDLRSLIIFATARTPEEALSDSSVCSWVKGISVLCNLSMFFTFTIITMERAVATIYYENYESFGCKLGYFLVLLQLFLATFFAILAFNDYPLNSKFVYCTSLSPNNGLRLQLATGVASVCEFLSAIVFHILLYINSRRRKRMTFLKLRARYQLTENINTLTLLIPLVWVHILMLCVITFLFNVYLSTGLIDMDYYIFEEVLNNVAVYGCIVPLIGFVEYQVIAKRKRQVMLNNFVNINDQRAKGTALSKAHFKDMKKIWG